MGKRVLFVDDDPSMGRVVQSLLQQHGYQVTLARTGEACLDMARATPPDIILLDILMPSMDGFNVCQELRRDARLREIPVVILTAMKDPNLNERAFAAGAEVCMTKPFRPENLITSVRMALQNAAQKQRQAEKKAEKKVKIGE